MRNRTLHPLLRAFTEDAAMELAAATANGAEVPFEVVEEPGARATLYCYRPLTGQFIRSQMGALDRLPSYLPAARALAAIDRLDAYLRHRGEPRIPPDPRERADAVLRTFLTAVFAETSTFELQPEAFAAAYAELERVLYEGRQIALVIAPVLGLALDSDEVPLGEGLSLVRGEALEEAPPEAVWSTPGEVEHGTVLAVLTLEGERLAGPPLTTARTRLRRLLSALRLFDDGSFALGPIAWARLDHGPWQVVPLGVGGRAGARTTIPVEQEDELRAFCNLVTRRTPRSGEVAWALARFEMARERATPLEALTDDLLALRALLEPEGPDSGRLAQRLAVICAMPGERAALAERIARAVTLERAVIAGLVQPDADAHALAEELAGHLRALLRDVLCGHLDSDVRSLADELLAEAAAEPVAAG